MANMMRLVEKVQADRTDQGYRIIGSGQRAYPGKDHHQHSRPLPLCENPSGQ